MLRIDAITSPGRFSLDNAAVIAELKGLGEQAARQNEKGISRRFLIAPAEPFSPLYAVEQAAIAGG